MIKNDERRSISLPAANIARRVGELIVKQDAVRDAFSRRPIVELPLVQVCDGQLFDQVAAIVDEELRAVSECSWRAESPLAVFCEMWQRWLMGIPVYVIGGYAIGEPVSVHGTVVGIVRGHYEVQIGDRIIQVRGCDLAELRLSNARARQSDHLSEVRG